MFTGIIQGIGKVGNTVFSNATPSLSISHTPWDEPLIAGESVAVQGVCLTVASVLPGRFECNVLHETLTRSNLGALRAGNPVNLERAIRAGDKLGGHMVSGHVDGTGCVHDLRSIGGDWKLTVTCSHDLLDGIVAKGSIAIDGVSLTVGDLRADRFDCFLVAFTWEHTTLKNLRAVSVVNLELDMLGKYARRGPIGNAGTASNVTRELLERSGFLNKA
mgnify:CR=1 FL=1